MSARYTDTYEARHRARLSIGQRMMESMHPIRTMDEVAKMLHCSRASVKFIEQQALYKVWIRMQGISK